MNSHLIAGPAQIGSSGKAVSRLKALVDAAASRPGLEAADTNVLSISGGKDSTALLLLARELDVPNLQAVFCDTGHEHPVTYAYVDYLQATLGLEIQRIRADFSSQMANKREYIARRWPADLMAGVPEVPGYWFRNDLEGCDSESDFPPAAPMPSRAPVNIYAPHAFMCWNWMPARRAVEPLTEERAAEVCAAAIAMLQPTGIPFLDLCLWKGRSPSTKTRFCTQELKVFPIQKQVFEPLLALHTTQDVYSWQGVRADESLARSKLPMQDEVGNGLINYRPLLHWSAADVFNMHRRHGIRWNPLYEDGMSRVGCMPCVNERKEGLANINRRYPEVIQRITRWEQAVSIASKRGSATLFTAVIDPTVLASDDISHQTHGIERMVEWSMTARGGRQFDLLAAADDGKACSSAYGLCE